MNISLYFSQHIRNKMTSKLLDDITKTKKINSSRELFLLQHNLHEMRYPKDRDELINMYLIKNNTIINVNSHITDEKPNPMYMNKLYFRCSITPYSFNSEDLSTDVNSSIFNDTGKELHTYDTRKVNDFVDKLIRSGFKIYCANI